MLRSHFCGAFFLSIAFSLLCVCSGGRDGAPSASSSSRGGAQSGRGGRGGKAAPGPKKEVSGADLDAELDSYHKQREAAAAPAAAAPDAGQPTTV